MSAPAPVELHLGELILDGISEAEARALLRELETELAALQTGAPRRGAGLAARVAREIAARDPRLSRRGPP